jgi:hypothetical protein
MGDISAFLWISLGVLFGVVYPVLLGFIRQEFPTGVAGGMPPWLKRYGGLLLFCLATALLILVFYKVNNPRGTLDWMRAFLLGFGWESFVEKSLKKPPPPPPNPGANPVVNPAA